MAFAAARMILKDKRRKSKEDFVPPRQRSKVDVLNQEHMYPPFDIFASYVSIQPRTCKHFICFLETYTDDDVQRKRVSLKKHRLLWIWCNGSFNTMNKFISKHWHSRQLILKRKFFVGKVYNRTFPYTLLPFNPLLFSLSSLAITKFQLWKWESVVERNCLFFVFCSHKRIQVV